MSTASENHPVLCRLRSMPFAYGDSEVRGHIDRFNALTHSYSPPRTLSDPLKVTTVPPHRPTARRPTSDAAQKHCDPTRRRRHAKVVGPDAESGPPDALQKSRVRPQEEGGRKGKKEREKREGEKGEEEVSVPFLSPS